MAHLRTCRVSGSSPRSDYLCSERLLRAELGSGLSLRPPTPARALARLPCLSRGTGGGGGLARGSIPRAGPPAEPPEMVIETLDSLARLDYSNYEVIVIDDNTADERLWRPVEAHCRKLGFKFFHLENWPGFKSGALNFALTKTDPYAEIVGVVDS